MPLGPYANFAACVAAQKRKGKSDLAARKICGYIEHQVQKNMGTPTHLVNLTGCVVMPDGRVLHPDGKEFEQYDWEV